MENPQFRSPTPGLLAGLAVALLAVVLYAAFTVQQIHRVRELQTGLVDRNRRDSLQLLRIQDNLHSLGLVIRDLLDQSEPYPLSAWEPQFARIRADLNDALRTVRKPAQAEYLERSAEQFWAAVDQTFREPDEARARRQFRDSIESRRASLASMVARLLVRNNESGQQAGTQIAAIYSRVERNVYIFLGAMLVLLLASGLWLIDANRRLFAGISHLSAQRSELARRLIGAQEDTLRHVSRELHDEFGQVLTAIGVMLQRLTRRGVTPDDGLVEAQEITQNALQSVRTLSQTLQPVLLQEQGLLPAIAWYLPTVQRQTGLTIHYEPPEPFEVDPRRAIHVFRILQEALNNVVRHAKVDEAFVRLLARTDSFMLEIEDRGRGMAVAKSPGMGLTAMRERASLIDGKIEISPGERGGTLVKLQAPR
ncbi:MAG: sensor histidine kinase [Bryobacteraceae bacterium]|nr:sensor histidine kinase [Bryobacteraceae bacterium]